MIKDQQLYALCLEKMNSPFLVHDYLSLSAQKFPDKEALICGDTRLTYREVDDFSGRLACYLISLGLNRGDRVVIVMDNSWEVVVSLYGILKAGGVFVTLNGGIKAGKLNYILRDSGALVLITHQQKAPVISQALEGAESVRLVLWADTENQQLPDVIKSVEAASFHNVLKKTQTDSRLMNPAWAPSDVDPQPSIPSIDLDLAALIYTSGSTGEPKGVMSSHRSMLAAARSIISYLENSSDDIILNALPLSFDYGLYQVLMTFLYGGTLVLEKSFAFPIKILEKIEQERVTGFPLVPTMAALLLGMKSLKVDSCRSLRYLTNTAAALPVDTIRRLQSLFPWAKLFSMYGLTECKRVSYLPPEELDKRPLSVGKPIPNCEAFIFDEDGKEVASGEMGELVIRGANVMSGYWKSPELSAKTFREGRLSGERLLYSGDLFKKDEEGFLYFVGRKDDLIKTRGERVSPREVENALCLLPEVTESAVIGMPDDILGQTITAYVVLFDGFALTEKEILKHCSNHLEPYMVPKCVHILKTLPKTPNGKVNKKALLLPEYCGRNE